MDKTAQLVDERIADYNYISMMESWMKYRTIVLRICAIHWLETLNEIRKGN